VSRLTGLLGLVLIAGAVAGAGEEPLRSWGFELDTDGWRSTDTLIERTNLRALEGGYSLGISVDLPQPASVIRRVNLDVDVVGRIVFTVYVPEGAPGNIRAMLFLKDKDGLWFQYFCEEALRPGQWNEVAVDISPSSPHLRPSGHHRLWTSVAAHHMNQIGIKFFCDDRWRGILFLDRVLAYRGTEAPEPLRILNLRENTLQVGRYEKFELTFDINRHVTNPFDPEQIKVDATFEDPNHKVIQVPAFYYQDFIRRLVNNREELTPVGAGAWKVRFAPMTPGTYTYYLTVQYTREPRKAPEPTLITGKRSFTCAPSKNRGFVRISKKDPLYFEFDNGQWFYPIGHNVHSPNDETPRAVQLQQSINGEPLPDRGTFSYDYLFKKMADNGENFAEVWMCSWWLGIEWIGDWRNYGGLTNYNLHSAWKLDYLLGLAEQNDLYLHLVLENHGKCSTWCDPEWEDNPYNELNGGFLASPEDFFRNPIAKEIYKKVLRYLIARWGYSTRLGGLELWSEVDLVGDSYTHDDPVATAPRVQWHRDMTEYLDRTDPWRHLVTTHFSTTYSRIKSTLVTLPGIDYITCDAYILGGGSIIPLVLATAQTFNAYGKPGLVTEYGGSPFGRTPAALRSDLHGGIWATYMTHTAGTPLLWWFQFIEKDDAYWNFKALAAFNAGEDRRGQGLVSSTVTFPNPHHDLGALALQNPRMAYVWVYSRSAMEQMPAPNLAPTFRQISIRLAGLLDGSYTIEVWDTRQGTVLARLNLPAAGGYLTVPLPDFRTDCAIKIKRAQ